MYSNIECSISIHREETSMILRSSSLELSGEQTLYRRKVGGGGGGGGNLVAP